MSSSKTLADLASALLSGSVRVVDLSAPLGPETPVIYLPPNIGKNTPPVKVHPISKYDADGPFWAWNWLELGEHTGTHFDAPRHWISGKDYPDGATDRIPVKNFVAPVNVIDRSKEATENADYLLTVESIKPGKRSMERSRRADGSCFAPTGTSAAAARRPSSTPTQKARIRLGRPPKRSPI